MVKLEMIFSDKEEVYKYRQKKITPIDSDSIKDLIVKLSSEKYGNRILITENDKNYSLNITGDDLNVAVKEIIDNAYKFGSEKSNIYVSEETEDNFYRLSVKNCGRGMTKEQILKVGMFQ